MPWTTQAICERKDAHTHNFTTGLTKNDVILFYSNNVVEQLSFGVSHFFLFSSFFSLLAVAPEQMKKRWWSAQRVQKKEEEKKKRDIGERWWGKNMLAVTLKWWRRIPHTKANDKGYLIACARVCVCASVPLWPYPFQHLPLLLLLLLLMFLLSLPILVLSFRSLNCIQCSAILCVTTIAAATMLSSLHPVNGVDSFFFVIITFFQIYTSAFHIKKLCTTISSEIYVNVIYDTQT